jgi:hypothetical protein
MTRGANACLAKGARLLARRKAVIAWVYLGFLGFGIATWSGAMTALGPDANASLYSQRLAGGFDVAALAELLSRQDIKIAPLAVRSIASMIGLGIVLWFCAAGIMGEFLSPQKLGAERFFQTCGAFWSRFVRLVLLSWLILFPVLGILGAIRTALVDAADKSWHVRLPFAVFLTASVIMQLILLALRGWFDTAELDMVHNNRPTARRALGEARRLTRGHRLQILWIYLVPAILMWVVVLLWATLWFKAPAAAVGLAFVLAQLIILTMVAGRMWERAAQSCWFLEHAPVVVEVPTVDSGGVEPLPAPAPPETPGELPQPEVDLP